jgi:hypothetical protein
MKVPKRKNEPALTKRQLAIKRKSEQLAPHCASFLSDLWKLPPENFMPAEIRFVERPPHLSRRSPAHTIPSDKVLEFLGRVPLMPSVCLRKLLVHELAHIGLLDGKEDYNTYIDACIGEGTAVFSEDEYTRRMGLLQKMAFSLFDIIDDLKRLFSWRHLSGKSRIEPVAISEYTQFSHYDTGFELVRQLSDAGISSPEILDHLFGSPPTHEELFSPKDYLDRMKGKHPAANPSSAEHKEWIRRAVELGTSTPWTYDEESKAFSWKGRPILFPSLFRLRYTLVNIPRALYLTVYMLASRLFASGKKLYHHLRGSAAPVESFGLPSPLLWGIRFVHGLEEKLGRDIARSILKKNPPESLKEIFEPDEYISRVHDSMTSISR